MSSPSPELSCPCPLNLISGAAIPARNCVDVENCDALGTCRRKEDFGIIGLGEHAHRRPSLMLKGSHATFFILGLWSVRLVSSTFGSQYPDRTSSLALKFGASDQPTIKLSIFLPKSAPPKQQLSSSHNIAIMAFGKLYTYPGNPRSTAIKGS